jgi:hypothetical protein
MAAPKLSERRVSQRYNLNFGNVCGHAIFEKSIALPLIDISYGGFSVTLEKPEHVALCETLARSAEVEVVILGVSTTGRAVRIFESKQRLGYAFCHDTASVLIFLRRFVEFMRLGEHLLPLEKNLLKPPYDSADWMCFRGDGPTDIVLHKTKSGGSPMVDEAMITFREKDSYRTAELRNGRLHTSISSDAAGIPNTRGSQESTLNEDILRKAACVVLGCMQTCSAAHQPALQHLYVTLRQYLTSPQTPALNSSR